MTQTKSPKRRVKENMYGNLIGYEGNRRVMDFGLMDASADEWLHENSGEGALISELVEKLKDQHRVAVGISGGWQAYHSTSCQFCDTIAKAQAR